MGGQSCSCALYLANGSPYYNTVRNFLTNRNSADVLGLVQLAYTFRSYYTGHFCVPIMCPKKLYNRKSSHSLQVSYVIIIVHKARF